MTDRYNAIVVVLRNDTRDDDAESILNAIRMIQGVLSVTPRVSSIDSHIAYDRARSDLVSRLWEALKYE